MTEIPRSATRLSTVITVSDNGYAFGTYTGIFHLKPLKGGGWILHGPDGQTIKHWNKRVSKLYVLGVALTAVLRRAGQAVA